MKLETKQTPRQHLTTALAEFSPEIAALARRALARMRKRLPGATQLVYDNYNNLVIGFGPSERASEAIFSIAIYPRSVGLCFLQGASLKDPQHKLEGGGNLVRHIRLHNGNEFDDPAIHALINQALRRAKLKIDSHKRGAVALRAVAPKRRARRPSSIR